MRRPVFSRPDDLDLTAYELIAAAARRAGMSLEEWTAAVLDKAQDKPTHPRRKAGSDLDGVIPRVSPPPRPRRDHEALMAAVVAQESERQARDQAEQTAIALESMANWIEQAEIRLKEATRNSADQQDRVAAVLSQALSSLKNRLDTVERQVTSQVTSQATSERAAPSVEFPMEEALKALAPVSETLTGLRADMSRLASRLEQPQSLWAPAVEDIRTEIEGLRSGIESLATRDEIAALDAALGSISKELEQGPTTRDLRTLANSITVLYEQVQSLSEEVSEGVLRRIGREIDQIKGKVDTLAATGIDRSVVDFLSGQIVDMRQDLAHRAEPQQIARLSDEIGTISRQVSELRLHQVSKSDFTSLKTSLDDVCSALYVTATAQETSKVPEQLETLSRRIDALVRRPDPVSTDLAPISAQLALLTERMANLSESRVGDDALTGTIERLSSRIEAVAERESPSHEPLMRRFDRIEQDLRELGQQTDAAEMARMLRSIGEKLDRTPPQPAGLDSLEQQIRALSERLEQMPGEALHTALTEATGHLRELREEAVGIAERAARTVLNDIRPSLPETGDFDAIKHGFVELKALHSRSDRKTQETLRAVHDALESLVSRLPNESAVTVTGAARTQPAPAAEPLPPADRLEAAVRRLHAATLTQIEEIAPPALDTALPEKPVIQAPDVAPEPDLGNVRANFIAAARRAAQTTALEETPPSTPAEPSWEAELVDAQEPESDETLSSPSSLFERLRRTLDNRRRPLLFGLAFLILAAGTYQILSVTQNLQDLSLAPATVQEQAQPAPAKRAAEAGKAIPADEGNLFQSSSLATGSLPTAPLPAGQFLVDPATIDGIPVDTPASLQPAALSGDAAVLYEIASRAAEGRGMAQDMKAAARLFERVSQAGLPPAQERLAMMHEKGEGVPLDLKQAAFWYERAALGGNIRAMHNLATVLASGKNGKPDYAAALRWYAEAAEYGLRDSQYNLGILLARGIGAKPDRSKAYQWFSLAANQGDAESAQKRDEIAVFLSQAEIKAAKAALELWRPRTADPIANEPPIVGPSQAAALDRTPGARS